MELFDLLIAGVLLIIVFKVFLDIKNKTFPVTHGLKPKPEELA